MVGVSLTSNSLWGGVACGILLQHQCHCRACSPWLWIVVVIPRLVLQLSLCTARPPLHRPSDETVASVASTNSACLRGTKDMFDSLKRVRTAAGESVRAKLTKAQVLTLLANRCILLLHMGKVRPRTRTIPPAPPLPSSIRSLACVLVDHSLAMCTCHRGNCRDTCPRACGPWFVVGLVGAAGGLQGCH